MTGRASIASALRGKIKVAVVGTAAALALMLCATAAAPPAQADAATLKCYTTSSANTPVYGNSSLSGNKIGAVYGSDEITVNSSERTGPPRT